MLFNSLHFILYFPIVFILYFLLVGRLRIWWLLIASYYFYMSWKPIYGLLLVYVTAIDFYSALRIQATTSPSKRNFWLIFSIVSNLGMLFYFKYFNFMLDSMNHVLNWMHFDQSFSLWDIILPIGISFHTFQSLSYTIDVYRGSTKAIHRFDIFALYVAFFPQLVAGPIERSTHFLPQFDQEKRFTAANFELGMKYVLWGYFKKLAVADRLAAYVNSIYSDPNSFSGSTLLLATYCFAIQIYCDFSGYSDIAKGCARMMGYDLITNFREPYFSTNIKEFWTRWHISLSTWFRDYVYIPLGGNRVSTGRMLCNLAIVFVVSGLWHGASWNYVIWGAIHGMAMIFYVLYSLVSKTDSTRKQIVSSCLGWLLTFHVVVLSWIFFRATNLTQAWSILTRIFDPPIFGYPALTTEAASRNQQLISVVCVAFLIIAEACGASRCETFLQKRRDYLRWSYYLLLLLMILNFGMFMSSEMFIYFQF